MSLVKLRDKARMSVAAWKDKLARKGLNEDGTIVPDDKSLDPPLGWVKPVHMHDIIRNMILSEEFKKRAREDGFETLEESDDFDEDYEAAPSSRYEVDDDLEPVGKLKTKNKAFHEETIKKAAKPPAASAGAPGASSEAPEGGSEPEASGPTSTST